jgi:hypothetical protein
MNVTLPNGKVISGVPDGTTKDAIMQKAILSGVATEQDFNQSAQAQPIPAQQYEQQIKPTAAQYAEQYPIPGDVPMTAEERVRDFPRYSAGEQIAALPETAAAMATGMTTGAVGFGAGSAVGAVGDLVGLLTQEEAQDLANRWASSLTYEPDSGASRKQLEAIGETLGVLPAVMGAGPMSGLGSRVKIPKPSITVAEIAAKKDFTAKGFRPGSYGAKESSSRDQITGAMASGDRQRVAAMADLDPAIAASRTELGLNEPGLPSAQSRNLQYRETEQALKKMPGSELSKIESNAIVELQQKADDLITEFGGRTDKSSLSMDLAERSTKSINELADLASLAYDDIGAAIPRQTKASLSRTGTLLKQELSDLGDDLSQMSPLERRLLKMSDSDTVTYAAVDKIRKEVGESIGKQSDKFKSESSASLKRIYSSLTDDQEVVANEVGMGEQWGAAKDLVKKRKQLEDNSVQMFGKNLSDAFMPKIGQAVKKMSGGDYKAFKTLVDSVPESQRQEVVMTALNDAFTLGSRKEKQLSVAGFADFYNGLGRNPAAKAELYKYMPKKFTKKLDAIGRVTNGIRNAQAAAPVGGQIMASQNVFDKVVNGVAGRFLSKLPGMIGDVISVGLEKSKSKGADNAIALLSDQDFVNNIKAIAKGQSKRADAIEKKLMRKKVFTDYVNTLPKDEAAKLSSLGLMGWLASDQTSSDKQTQQ